MNPDRRLSFVCLGCGVEGKYNPTQRNGLYCSNRCQQDHAFEKKYKRWCRTPAGVRFNRDFLRKALIRRDGYECFECGIGEWQDLPIVLEIEHVNGNSDDDRPVNICFLCPNCHSQTPTYKNRNKGKGRHYRRLRYANGQSY